MSILQRGIAWKFCVGQTRSTEIELIGTNRVGREKIVRSRSANNVILINTVAADPDRANERAITIERKAARENRNSVRQIQSDAVP